MRHAYAYYFSKIYLECYRMGKGNTTFTVALPGKTIYLKILPDLVILEFIPRMAGRFVVLDLTAV